MFKSDLRQYTEQEKLKLNKKLKAEGYNVTLNKDSENTQIVSKVSTEIPNKAKIQKDEKQSFEDFKTVCRGQIDEKCLADYGSIEDKDLWEDCAKELYLQSRDYIPNSEDKPQEELVEGKTYTGHKIMDIDINKETPIQTVRDNNGTAFNIYYKDGKYVDGNGCEVEDEILKKYKLENKLNEDTMDDIEDNIFTRDIKTMMEIDDISGIKSYLYDVTGSCNKDEAMWWLNGYKNYANTNPSLYSKIIQACDEILQRCFNVEEDKKPIIKDTLEESQVSDYTIDELKEVLKDPGNDYKIQIAGSESKTKWLNIDKEDLKRIGSALSSGKESKKEVKTEAIEYEKDYQTIFSEIDLKDIGSAVYDCIKESKLSEAAVLVILSKLKTSYGVKLEESEFYTNEAENVYKFIQEEMSNKQRKELFKKYHNSELKDMDEFWDWLESLDSDEIESLDIPTMRNN